MKKVSRQTIRNDFFYAFDSNAGRYLDIVKCDGTYYAIEIATGIAYVKGKELKGYIGDILYFQYDGVGLGTGNYYLKSDRHGVVCKWKDIEILGSPKSFEEAVDRFCDALENNLNR